MAPYELDYPEESLYGSFSTLPTSMEQIRFLAKTFRHIAWLNPLPALYWDTTWTVNHIRSVFPMFELSLDGLEKAVRHLVARH